ncbi:MAG: isochorismatase family protein [Deltaproteobacteria bacterium]|nr:isochorismatase family protein [Deltaproteobacteria bacterium]
MIQFEGREVPETLEEVVQPKRTVLLVWDMQNDQAGSSFNKEEFLHTTPPLIDAARRAGVPVVFAQSTPYPWHVESPAMIRRAMQAQNVDHPSKLKPRRTRGSFGWQLIEPFKPEEGDVVIDKRRATMFLGTEFESLMIHWGTRTVVMVGCTTDGGVEGTVRDGYYRGYFMVVVKDCVGTRTEKGHLEALGRMERWADVVQSHDLIKLWRS